MESKEPKKETRGNPNIREVSVNTRFTKGIDPKHVVLVDDLKKKDLRKMIEAELSKKINGVTRAEGLVARLITMGIQGNMRAIELILAYLYGKPQNQVIEADNKPFVLELTEPEKDEVETMKHSYTQFINQEVNETNGKADVSL